MSKTALYAGSFDPLTLGHLDIIKRSAKLFDKVVVAVVINPNKTSLFSPEERVKMISEACRDIDNISVDSFSGLLADYVNASKFDAVIRGVRNTTDYEYEQMMANINAGLYRFNTDTVFLMTKPELSYISSSAVKEVASLGGDISNFVTEDIKNEVISKYRRNQQ